MSIEFQGPEMKASSKNTRSLVVLLHGYGASGDDLITLGRQWSSIIPDTDFVAPNAPRVCEQNPNGYQWCSLKDWDPRRLSKEIHQVSGPLNQYIDQELTKRGLGFHQLALVGFSLGTFVALDVALHRPSTAGVVGYSGGYLHDISRVKVGRPPVILIHGEQDQVLPHDTSLSAEKTLKNLGIEVKAHIIPEVEHHIDVQGLGMGAAFLKQHLYEDREETKNSSA